MAKLWVFGDSFSQSHRGIIDIEDRDKLFREPSVDSGQFLYIYNIYKNSNRVPTHFEDVLSKEFELEFGKKYNLAGGGFSNYDILETIGQSENDFSKDDFVIIGWSDLTRFRVLDDETNWVQIHIEKADSDLAKLVHNRYFDKKGNIEKPKIILERELQSWIKLINKALPKNTIHWSPFSGGLPPISTITDETNMEYEDGHYSETGHKQIAQEMIKWFKELQ